MGANILLYNNLIISLVKNTQVFQIHSGGQETSLLNSKDTALHKKQLGYNSFDSTRVLGHNCGESTTAWLDPHTFPPTEQTGFIWTLAPVCVDLCNIS